MSTISAEDIALISSDLILPGTLAFNIALTQIPPLPTWRAEMEKGSGQAFMICRPGSMGLMESVTEEEWVEYMNDGEYDARQEEIDALDEELEGVIIA